MSEFTKTSEQRLAKLIEVSKLVLETGNAHRFIVQNKAFIPTVIPGDFIALFDYLVKKGYSVDELKRLANKVLNIFHNPIKNYPRIEPAANSFLGVLEQNNREMVQVLDNIRQVFKAFVNEGVNNSRQTELLNKFKKLEVFAKHYTIKENVLFPAIENVWPDYRCLHIMWSIHDDIRANIKSVIQQLDQGIIDIKDFNRSVGDIFFNMMAIKFREEHILFPAILTTIPEDDLKRMNRLGAEIGYPYVHPRQLEESKIEEEVKDGFVNLGTGNLSIEQIILIFNHLPVDITYVDENNKVRYFSTPTKRIFPRTTAIIGREVKNCHPPESVHVVEKIVESFKSGEKDKASFWIKMKGELILIQYFALRDHSGSYKGVIEVSQEISEIKSLEGEKRLLDW
ncbi:MAG TPA: PAS domain-containing protein [Draconibacterium sp.]|nr:PAS domain-containing protein [Draconibacterium sp.]